MRRLVIAATILALTATVSGKAPGHIHCVPEFGVSFQVPKGLFLCPSPPDVHEHGFLMLFNSKDTSLCSDSNRIRYIELFASYNCVDSTKTLKLLYQDQLNSVIKSNKAMPLSDLKVKGLRCMAARVDSQDGMIEVIIVTQAGKPDPDFDPSVPTINYLLRLRTNGEHYNEDLVSFKEVLEHLTIAPAEQKP